MEHPKLRLDTDLGGTDNDTLFLNRLDAACRLGIRYAAEVGLDVKGSRALQARSPRRDTGSLAPEVLGMEGARLLGFDSFKLMLAGLEMYVCSFRRLS